MPWGGSCGASTNMGIKNRVDVYNCKPWLSHSGHTRLNYSHPSIAMGGIVNIVKPAYDSTRVLMTLE